MRSMITNYAHEGKTDGGQPSGTFWMSEATADAASMEVLATHKGLTGTEL